MECCLLRIKIHVNHTEGQVVWHGDIPWIRIALTQAPIVPLTLEPRTQSLNPFLLTDALCLVDLNLVWCQNWVLFEGSGL